MDGRKLRKRRLAKGLGRQRLAQLSGVSVGAITRAETGVRKLRSPQAAKISAALRSA